MSQHWSWWLTSLKKLKSATVKAVDGSKCLQFNILPNFIFHLMLNKIFILSFNRQYHNCLILVFILQKSHHQKSLFHLTLCHMCRQHLGFTATATLAVWNVMGIEYHQLNRVVNVVIECVLEKAPSSPFKVLISPVPSKYSPMSYFCPRAGIACTWTTLSL